MRKHLAVVLVGATLLVTGACQSQQPPESAEPETNFQPTATIKDIMDAIVDPSADAIWDSVATIISIEGTEERAPQTDEEWQAVRFDAIKLVEATNLLQVHGRAVAPEGHQSENPGIELEPSEIATLIDGDWPAWIMLANGLHDAAVITLQAIDAKDATALSSSGEGLDQACENCHLKYWYPLGGPSGAAAPQQ